MFKRSIVSVCVLFCASTVFAEIRGDFNHDGILDAADVNLYAPVIASQKYSVEFDLRPDGVLDAKDLFDWVTVEKNTWLGDFNFDGEFNSGDLVHAFVIGEYEDVIKHNSVYTDGDVTADGEFNASDLVHIFQNSTQCIHARCVRPRGAIANVPEPNSGSLLAVAITVCMAFLRKRRDGV